MTKRWQDIAKETVDEMRSRKYPQSVIETVVGAMDTMPSAAREIADAVMKTTTPREAVKAVQPYLRAV